MRDGQRGFYMIMGFVAAKGEFMAMLQFLSKQVVDGLVLTFMDVLAAMYMGFVAAKGQLMAMSRSR